MVQLTAKGLIVEHNGCVSIGFLGFADDLVVHATPIEGP